MRTFHLARRGLINYITRRPFCVSFEITRNCNARCKHCHLGEVLEENLVTPERIGEICRELRPVVAQVSGGEPLLRKDLDEILRAIRTPGHDPFIVITTNGTLLTKERYFQLLEAGVDEFSLSLDYPDERHDQFRKVPGLFGRIKKFVESLEQTGDKKITLACVVQSDNFSDLPKMAELAKSWGVKVNFSSYTCMRTQNTEYMIGGSKIEEFKAVVEQLKAFRNQYNTIRNSDYVFRNMIRYFQQGRMENCRAGERFIIVNSDGSLSPCGLVIRNFKSQEEVRSEFLSHNKCEWCYTSIRAGSERPAWYLFKDNLSAIFK
jgi:MoaA/NifB/PqqE/SkfB family radical SAM enzyme